MPAAADRLEVQVLVDTVTDTLSTAPAFVSREQQVLRHAGNGGRPCRLHPRIVNVLHAARDAFPGEGLHAVMGGFHLSGENEGISPDMVRDLGAFGHDPILPAHCTGGRSVAALLAAYGEGMVAPAAVGKRFTFRA